MRKNLSVILFFLLLSLFLKGNVLAIYDPNSVPNNIVGIHILFPEEVSDASTLVNSNGGDWGYITIPIQSTDRDLAKWQTFMDNCRKYHLIPIVRLATEGDYFNTSSWNKPDYADVLDFANFLNSLNWPTKNRYIVVYNEVNRNDEWGGQADPGEYADILDYATQIFKQRSTDFFIISAGMDNAAANSDTAYNEYSFFRAMESSDPEIFSKIDGMASHAYPNPAFSSPPASRTYESIYSFNYERNLIDYFAGKTLPIFITETGWSTSSISDTTQSQYYSYAFANVWNDPDIVAVTPFLFSAQQGQFTNFSFVIGSTKAAKYYSLENIKKIKGLPTLTEMPLVVSSQPKKLQNKSSFEKYINLTPIKLDPQLNSFVKWFFKI